MGCCSGYPSALLLSHKSMLNAVDDDMQSYIFSSNGAPATINDPIAILENVTLNPLAYSLWCGRFNTFRILKENMGASIVSMETLLEKQNLSGIEILMKKGYLEMLKYYLPEYLLQYDSKVEDSEVLKKPMVSLAVANGYVHVVKYIYMYFIHVCPPPAFDLFYVNPLTGENSALVASKNCNLPMVRLLHERCNVDFTILNHKNQSALELAVIGSKKKLNSGELFIYLIVKCGVRVDHRYEFILENITDGRTIEIMQEKLEEIGILYKKKNYQQEKFEDALQVGDVKSKYQDESLMTLAEISSITLQDSNNMLSFSMFQEE